MRAILIDIGSCGSDNNIEVYFDMCVGGRGRRRGEANGVVARLVRSESKLAIVRPTRTDDIMPRLHFLDRAYQCRNNPSYTNQTHVHFDENAEISVFYVFLFLFTPFKSFIVSYSTFRTSR